MGLGACVYQVVRIDISKKFYLRLSDGVTGGMGAMWRQGGMAAGPERLQGGLCFGGSENRVP